MLHKQSSSERKVDRRTIYTRNAIMDAYMQLLKSTPKNKIKITEVCRIAEINRCTFYLHFEDIQAVENAIIEKLIRKFKEHLKTQTPDHKDRQLLSSNFINTLLQDDTYITLMSTLQTPNLFSNFIEDIYISNMKSALPKDHNLSEEQQKLLYNFIVGGVVSVEQSWIQNNANVYEENKFLDKIVQLLLTIKDDDR